MIFKGSEAESGYLFFNKLLECVLFTRHTSQGHNLWYIVTGLLVVCVCVDQVVQRRPVLASGPNVCVYV